RVFGGIWGKVDTPRRKMARRHMSRVLPEGSDADSASREVMRAYGRYYAEALWARARRVPGILAETEVIGLENILNARDAGNGMIFALPHMGNWEAAAPVAVSNGVPVVAVAEVLPNRRITDWFTSMRAEFGIEIVLATGRVEVMRNLERAIAENKAVALLCDRDLTGKGVSVEFFGEETTLPPGPASLAVRTGTPLLPIGCYFVGDGYRVDVGKPVPMPEEGSKSERVRKLTEDLAGHLEELIRAAPDQWHLVVPNWPSDIETSS
ncbi:MAG: phosphatidylinositol mannoside acyltransferase, partial [Acidimicrobiia bacterium]